MGDQLVWVNGSQVRKRSGLMGCRNQGTHDAKLQGQQNDETTSSNKSKSVHAINHNQSLNLPIHAMWYRHGIQVLRLPEGLAATICTWETNLSGFGRPSMRHRFASPAPHSCICTFQIWTQWQVSRGHWHPQSHRQPHLRGRQLHNLVGRVVELVTGLAPPCLTADSFIGAFAGRLRTTRFESLARRLA